MGWQTTISRTPFSSQRDFIGQGLRTLLYDRKKGGNQQHNKPLTGGKVFFSFMQGASKLLAMTGTEPAYACLL